MQSHTNAPTNVICPAWFRAHGSQHCALTLAACALIAFAGKAVSQTSTQQSADQSLRFSIDEIRTVGNTLLDNRILQAVVQSSYGSGKTLNAIHQARLAILEAYRQQGYELISVDYNARLSRDRIHYFQTS
jgi:hypothetical protein